MRTQRIFWFLICFIPNVVFAQATAAHASIVETALAKHKTTISSNIAASKAAAATDDSSKSGMQGTAAVTTNEKLLALAQNYAAAVESCTAKTTIARTMCLEESAPSIAQFMSKYGALMQGASTAVSGISGTCESVGKVMNAANIMMGVYQVACATAQGVCESSCLAADKALESYASAVKSATGVAPTATSAHTKTIASASKDKAQISGVCASFAANAAQAIPGAVLALQAYKTAQNCEDQNSTTDAGIDCTNPQNAAYNQKSCMCTRNELPAAECQNQVVANTVKGPGVQTGGKVTFDKDGNPVPDFSPAENGVSLADTGSGSGGLPGAPSGGGGGVGGAGGGTGGGAQDGFAGGGRRLNTNVTGGFGGGGGAGFGSGAGYGEDPSLRAYKPGGAKDPSRTIASQLAKEVTGQGGRSNWEKVKSRYIDNSRKLLGN